jgi:plastocyanin
LLLAVAPALVSAATIQVQVGAGGTLLYNPENVAAAVGDQVVFNFNPKNHTVTQSSFAGPCSPGGLNSGLYVAPIFFFSEICPTKSDTACQSQLVPLPSQPSQ